MKETTYQICTRCVMDTSDSSIVFGENGFCNHCTNSISKINQLKADNPDIRKKKLDTIISEIKRVGKGKPYDCIIGISGGVDSSYLAYLVKKEYGLRPLAIHLDNGWNSELAVKNIENIVTKLNIDLYTWVINWEEFKELQIAFLKSSVIDLEMLSDNAIIACIYKLSKKYKIPYFLDGVNIQTEDIMPESWFYSFKTDSLNIRSIYKKFGSGKKLQTYPLLSFVDLIRYFKGGIKQVSLLNYIDYNKDEAKKFIENELDWKDYGGKHYESRITQFYQAFLLPQKYNVDKRRSHLSSLIISGQLTREEALEELKKPLYESDLKLKEDKEFFAKKLGFSPQELNEIMTAKPAKHSEFLSYKKIFDRLSTIRNLLRK